jgi:hypothetical protein
MRVFLPAFLAVALAGGLAHAQTQRLSPADIRLCRDEHLIRRGFDGCSAQLIATACERARLGQTALPTNSCAPKAMGRYRICQGLPSYSPGMGRNTTARLQWCIEHGARDPSELPTAVADQARAARPEELLQDMDADAGPASGFVLNGAGAADVTTMVLQASAQFLVDRARAEVLDLLHRTLGRDLCAPLPGTQTSLFPSACRLLNQEGGTNPSLALSSLPTSLQEDLRNAPRELLMWLGSQLIATAGAAQAGALSAGEVEALRYGLDVGWRVAEGLRTEGPLRAVQNAVQVPLPVVAGVPPELALVQRRFRAVVAFLQQLEPRLRDLGSAPVDATLVAEVSAAARMSFGDNADMTVALDWLDTHREEVARVAARFHSLGHASGSERGDSARALAREVLGLVDKTFETSGSLGPIQPLIHEALGCYDAFSQGQTVLGVTRLLSLTLVQRAIDRLPEGTPKTILTRLRSHLLLVGTLAAATTGEEVQAALNAAAAPPRSWREYRRRRAIFVSGWVGVMGSYEIALGSGNNGFAVSPTIMIGPEFGMPLANTGWSFNLYVPILDLGALASLRLGPSEEATSNETATNGTARRAASVELATVFAPGVFVGVGIADTPIVVALGVQYAPGLREYFRCSGTDRCQNTDTLSTIRVGLTLSVDLPLLPIY